MIKKFYTLTFSFFLCLVSLSAHNFDVLVYMNASPTTLDNTALGAINNLGFVHSFGVTTTASASDFNTTNLSNYGAVIFLNINGSALNATQKGDFEAFVQAGNGCVAIHSAATATGGWTWFSDLMGEQVTTQLSSQAGTIIVADQAHPSSRNLPQVWNTTDAWYNLLSSPRGEVHILATLDENTISGGVNGDDHPVSWCHDYDGGRVWVTTLGGVTGLYSDTYFLDHLLGGIEWAAGAEIGDAGATIESNFDITILDDNNTDPIAIDIAPDGRVFYIQKNGVVNIWKPTTNTTVQAAWVAVFPGGENGMIGMALDPNFPTSPYIYLHYTHQDGNWGNTGPGTQRISRFSVSGDAINMASEEILLTYVVDRAAEIHSAGCMDFDGDGNLLISTGDNTSYGAGLANPYTPIDERSGQEIYDAQRTSGNTDDFRGKILRIKPSATIGGGYTIPTGNLFPATDSTLAEIYLMGLRNPFKFTVDTLRNWVSWGDVGPDAVTASATRGPIGKDEFNLAKSAGNYGWPYFTGDNSAYIDYNFATSTSGAAFDPLAPYNDSPNSTGKKNLPPAQPALIWEDKNTTTPEFPMLGGGNATAIGGAFYHYNPALASTNKLPEYFDKTLFIVEWNRNWIKEVKLDANGNLLKINPFLPSRAMLRPMDLKVGPDGCLYLLEWDLGWGGGGNTNSRISRIEYSPNGRSPLAVATADVTDGPVSLTVSFDGSGSVDPAGKAITHSWDFGDASSTSSAINPTHTYTTAGVYSAKLTVTNTDGKTGTAVITITAGNSSPTVNIVQPVDGGFFEWNDFVQFDVAVTDPEDGSTALGQINCNTLTNQTLVGHDSHAHPSAQYSTCSGSFQTPSAGHSTTEDALFYLFEARYTDQGATGTGTLTHSKVHFLNPKLRQAEHYTNSSGVTLTATADALSVSDVTDIDDGDYISFDPMNLLNITAITFRVAAGGPGGTIEVRKGATSGLASLVATAVIPTTGSYSTYTDVTIPITDPGGTDEYFFVFKNSTNPNNLFHLNWMQFDGAGIGSALPVELVNFEAKAIANRYVRLSWETLSELNSSYFAIQRTVNPNGEVDIISTQPAQGSTGQRNSYDFQDFSPYPGQSFYRLVEYDLDGQQHFTEWKRVELSQTVEEIGLEVYPNPTEGEIQLYFQGQKGHLSLQVFSTSGTRLLTEESYLQGEGMETRELDLRDWAAGMYILRLENGDAVYHEKIVVGR